MRARTRVLPAAMIGILLTGGAQLAQAQNSTAGDNTDMPAATAPVHHRHHRRHRASTTSTGAPAVNTGAPIIASRPNGGTGNAGNAVPAPGPDSAAPGSEGNPPTQSKNGNGSGGGGS